MTSDGIVVVMPARNEEEGIAEFLNELHSSLLQHNPSFVVVDDLSNDNTSKVVEEMGLRAGINVSVIRNTVNLGHGPSTMKALLAGLSTDASAVVAIDGDGQFMGADVAKVVQELINGNCAIVEGVRTQRNDAFYRKVTSFFTRLLVWTRCGSWPADANTPLRAYDPDTLKELLELVPSESMTPNLLFSALSRRRNIMVCEVNVVSQPRRGSTEHGATWGARRKSLPTRRFMNFCAGATRQWINTSI